MPGEDSYSSNSGSSDSETSDHNKTSSTSTSTSTSPTAELHKYKFDHLDTYSISDVLICHTDKLYKNCVIWVIRKSGSLEALVFECLSEEYARQLYRKFHEVSKRSKLERHRRRKSDGGSIITRQAAEQPATPKIKSGADRGSVTINNPEPAGEAEVDISSSIGVSGGGGNQKWNLVQHTDKNGVTHIEVESNNLVSGRQQQPPRDSEPRSLLSFSPAKFSARGVARGSGSSEKSKFAKELENILSSEIKRREDLSGTTEKNEKELIVPSGGGGGGRSRPHGESLSLRQRAPALLLRKLDEFEEKAHRIWARAEAEEENRKIWSKGSNSVIGITSPPRGPQLEGGRGQAETGSRGSILDTSRSNLNSPKLDKIRHKKGKEETRNFSQLENSNANRSKQKETSVTKKEDANRILIPTKTGKEPPKKLYPKESPPIFSGRFMPINMGHQVAMNGQPHSLPIYPLPLGWNRIPADMAQLDVWKYNQEPWRAPAPVLHQERSRSRDRGRMDPDQRRRAQSKSPARRPTASRYMDSIPSPDTTGLGRMFRGLGDAVRNRMGGGRRGDTRLPSSAASDIPEIALKSNLKKQRNLPPDILNPQVKPQHNITSANNNNDNKKVHFNKFATVQMMAWTERARELNLNCDCLLYTGWKQQNGRFLLFFVYTLLYFSRILTVTGL